MPEKNPQFGCVWKSVFVGALGGLVASYAMNQFQSVVSTTSSALSSDEGNDQSQQQQESNEQQSSEQQSGDQDDATVKTAKAISSTLFKHELTSDEKKWAGPAVHYGFGMTLGAIYGALAETLPLARAGSGTLYGAAAWLGADEIGVPAVGLSGSPFNYPLSSHANALASHLIFGFTTDLTRRIFLPEAR